MSAPPIGKARSKSDFIFPTKVQKQRAESAEKINEVATQALSQSCSLDSLDQWTPQEESKHGRTQSSTQEKWLEQMHKPKKRLPPRKKRMPPNFGVVSIPISGKAISHHTAQLPIVSAEELNPNDLEEGVISAGYSPTIYVNPSGKSDLPEQVVGSMSDGKITAKYLGRTPSGETTPLINDNATQWDTPQDPLLRIEERPKERSLILKCLWCWPKKG